ncbi:ATP-binding protein [uncultured Bacteroides sp.]|uniref:ATP-binding protein n=1 Tax=uncultured Bacteroides sp. TaxID=162156 RepID=UPI000820F609|nr:ATP-binding protein [uncultured Bacteroides sp.]SCI18285.1 Predicted AAA-ATPase [uncultured Bacteroides sp.]
MAKVKGLPYGVARFEQIRNENSYYVDKTMYLPLLEDTSNYLFLIRPRRFGKSVFVSMMEAYYDIAKADKFDTLFDGLWIQEHPTPLKNSFQVIYFDFSKANNGLGDLELNFNNYCSEVLDTFINRYRDFYSEQAYHKIISTNDAGVKLNVIDNESHEKGYPLYLIIDEYDNFTNVILSDGGKELFRNLTHASGFYREYFKKFKAMFARVFLIGVSPVTLDDLSSGYNIDWGISQDPRFNDMLGFSETDVREMFQYYKDNGKLLGDIDEMIEEMKPWYNNYCFAEECLNEPRMFNCDMTFYYLRHWVLYNRSPKEMVDKNIRTDYKKLKMLADIDRGNQRENRMSVIEEIAATGFVRMKLKSSFPAEYVTDDDNFRSLLYYYGLLTMGSSDFGEIKMVIPNNCVKEQYWAFMRDYYRKSAEVDFSELRDYIRLMARDGNWQPLVKQIAAAYKENSSVRDSILGEHNLQGFFKAYLALNSLYLVEPEIELSYGYSDFLLLPDKVRYPEVLHSYILELKYVKPHATDDELAAKSLEADKQLQQYSSDKIVKRLCTGTQRHLVKIIFRGAEMVICEEL